MERLQKVLAHRGVASRRRCEELILEGKVKVNGQVVTELGIKVNPDRDKIEVDGIKFSKKEEKVYFMLNKPVGFVTTVSDPRGRRTVTDLLRGIRERVYPIGRLDYDTEGLLLLSNDGDLTYALTHPKHETTKTYLARVKGIPSKEALHKLKRGVRLRDGLTAPAQVKLISKQEEEAVVEIKIHEGRNRQVRRMFEYIGHPVLKLKRTKVAFLDLKGLKVGEFRPLMEEEVNKLKELVIL